MKECKECEYFDGYDYSDGTPYCNCDGGYEACPFNDQSNIRNNGIKIELDTGFMSDYIRHTLKNTIENKACNIATAEIKKLITDELQHKVEKEIEKQVEKTISEAISEFMKNEITVGGGWSEPERKITREQYLAETIEKELKSQFKADAIKSYAQRKIQTAIDKYDKSLRDEINEGIRTYFDAATREVLTQNIVSMLMSNDTYIKLSNSMNTFLPSKDKSN